MKLTVNDLETLLLRLPHFSLQSGEMVGVIGPSDAGKTLLLKTLAGLIPMQHGHVTLDDEPHQLYQAPWRSRVGMSFQHDALFDEWTVFDNIAFVLRQKHVPDDEIRTRVQTLLERVGLWQARDKHPYMLSGGMRKRVGVVRAMVADPCLGVFDEPDAGLDPQTSHGIFEVIAELSASMGMAAVLVSHALPLLLQYCTRLLMLVQGRVVYDGPARAIVNCSHPMVMQFVQGSMDGPL